MGATLPLGLAVLLVLARGIFRFARRTPAKEAGEVRVPAELEGPAARTELSAAASQIAAAVNAAPAAEYNSELAERVRMVAKRRAGVDRQRAADVASGKQKLVMSGNLNLEPISGATKAAMFLMGIGDQISAELLRKLDAEEIRRVTAEIAASNSVAPQHMVSVFREFESLTGSSRFFAKGGSDSRAGWSSRPSGRNPRRSFWFPGASAGAGNRGVESRAALVAEYGPAPVGRFPAKRESANHRPGALEYDPRTGGALLQQLPAELHAQVALRMATLDRVSPEVFRKITEAIGSKLKAIRQVSRSDGIRSRRSAQPRRSNVGRRHSWAG